MEIGYHVIEPQGTKLKNLLSVSLVSSLGLILTIIDFGKLFSPNTSGISIIYSITTSSIFFVISNLKGIIAVPSLILFIIVPIYNLLPSLLLWVGIEYHNKKGRIGSESNLHTKPFRRQ